MLRRSLKWLRIRTMLAESSVCDYNLGLVAATSTKLGMPVHIHYPSAPASSASRLAGTMGLGNIDDEEGTDGMGASLYPPHQQHIQSLANTQLVGSGSGVPGGMLAPEGLRVGCRKPLELLLVEPIPSKHLGIFADGVIVAFDMSAAEVESFRKAMTQCQRAKEAAIRSPHPVAKEGRYTLFQDLPTLGYEPPEAVDHSYIDEGPLDALVLRSDEPIEKLPFISCLAELVQIENISGALAPIANTAQLWKDKVQATGSLPCSLTESRMVRAQLNRLESRQAKIDNRQQIFWTGEFNHLRSVFNDAYDFYEVQHRNAELKLQMEAVGESVGYLSEETHAETNHRLEWVIIILIFLELMNALLTH